MKFLILISALVTCTVYGQKRTTNTPDPFQGLDTALQRLLKDRKGAGFAVAVVNRDKIVYAKGFGYRDLDKKLPVTANTIFPIGSCTKAFTSALMGILSGENKLEFDKPVLEYLPSLRFFNKELDNMVTVRDLMCHRTGLPRHDYSWYLFNSNSRDSLMRRIQYHEPTLPIRQGWQYNNFMFLLQGMIAEKITGKSWEDYVREKIFTPLEMKNSNFSIHDLNPAKDVSLGYMLYKDSIIRKMDYYDINAMGPAGSINSSVNEMANWVITWINNGKFKGKEVLPIPYPREAISAQMIIGPGLPDKEVPDAHFSAYGLGWMLASYRGHYRVEHGGNIDGFSASTSFFPTDSIGIIVLSNQNGSAIPGIVRNMIADRVLGEKPIDWNGRANEAVEKARKAAAISKGSVTSSRKPGTKPSHELNDYTGLYTHKGYGSFELENRNDSLIMHTRNGDGWLRHYHYDVFEVFNIDEKEGIDTSGEGLKLHFRMGVNGDISGVGAPLQPGLDEIEFLKTAKPKPVAVADLRKFEGTYSFAPGQDAKFYLKGETLFAFIEGQPEYELVPTGKNKFDLKAIQGYSVQFEENEKGEVIAATFVQPNGSFKASKTK